jgi:hypothetical protein
MVGDPVFHDGHALIQLPPRAVAVQGLLGRPWDCQAYGNWEVFGGLP